MADPSKIDSSQGGFTESPRENYASGPREQDIPTGVVLKADGSNLVRRREALSNHLTGIP